MIEKERVKLQVFESNSSDWFEWKKLLGTYVGGMDNDLQLRNYLYGKLDTTAKNLVKTAQNYEQCIQILESTYGDTLRTSTQRINDFVIWAQEKPPPLSNMTKITEDMANLSSQMVSFTNPRGNMCLCDDKKGCKLENHVENDHCIKHCEYKVLREDSDKLHSFLTALASNRIPPKISENAGMKQREEERSTGRPMEARAYVNLCSDILNNLKTTSAYYNTENVRAKRETAAVASNMKPKSDKPRAERKCALCNEKHCLFCCENPNMEDENVVKEKIKEAKLCFVCFKPGHRSEECKSKNKRSCSYCQEKGYPHKTHNKLLCHYRPSKSNPDGSAPTGRDGGQNTDQP